MVSGKASIYFESQNYNSRMLARLSVADNLSLFLDLKYFARGEVAHTHQGWGQQGTGCPERVPGRPLCGMGRASGE